MAQNVKIPIITTHFEEHGIWTIPLIDDLFDEVAVVVDPEPDRAFVSSAAGVKIRPAPSYFSIVGLNRPDRTRQVDRYDNEQPGVESVAAHDWETSIRALGGFSGRGLIQFELFRDPPQPS